MNRPAATVRVIAGPTASGKSALALAMATDENGVIINADSMQVYDALRILTASPDDADRARAPHALYNILPPDEICSAARWAAMALPAIARALDDGRLPIVVGGTGLYLRALMHGLSPIPALPPATRDAAIAAQKAAGNPGFHALLAARDPVMAARLHPHDTQRLVRAWEVFEGTGRSLATWQALPPLPPALPDGTPLRFAVTVFDLPRATLHDRCHRRLDIMLAQGALEEVSALDDLITGGGAPPDAPVTNALGYTALRDYQRGLISHDEAMTRTAAQTRQYIKRQCTWLRNQITAESAPFRGAIDSLQTVTQSA